MAIAAGVALIANLTCLALLTRFSFARHQHALGLAVLAQ